MDLAAVGALERLPIDSLWVGGHVASRNPSPEAMVALARLSAVTDRVRIGTSVLLLPLYEPAIVAKQVADLDRATGGRIILGVGVGGEYPTEFRACHVPIDERGRRTDEAIDVLRKLWTAETIDHDGPAYPLEAVRVHPAPSQPGGPPIVIGGRGATAMRRAAERGDGWMPYLYSARRYANSLATIEQIAGEAERTLDRFGWYAFVFVHVDRDGDLARSAAAAALGGMYQQDLGSRIDELAAVGTPVEVADVLSEFVDAGARHLVLVPIGGNADTSAARVEVLLSEVVPLVRQRAGTD